MGGDRGLESGRTAGRNPSARLEGRDANVRAIWILAIGLVLFITASVVMLNGLSRYSEMHENASQGLPTGTNIDLRNLPPEPRLQIDAVRDLLQIQAAEERTLTSYGWVDQRKGVVRIPIDRAIDLLAQRGLSGHTSHAAPNSAGKANLQADASLASGVQ